MISVRPARRLRFALSLMIGLIAGIPAAAHADDTEIYVGNSSLFAGLRPNVLFIFDTSGSMSQTDGFSDNRMTRLQNAMFQVLEQMDNVNVGIMRFSDPGGPVLFPISYIDADASAIDKGNQPDVTVAVNDANDDVEELLSDHTVTFDDVRLDLAEVQTFGTNVSRTFEVTSNIDDYSEFDFFGFVFPRPFDASMFLQRGLRHGLRFRNVTIPRNGAGGTTIEILHAAIEFVGAFNESGPTTLRFSGDDVGNSAPFPSSFFAPGTIAERLAATKTTAAVDWDVPEWFPDEHYTSTELKSIVQEIVNRSDWAQGNSLSFLIEPQAGSRRAQTFDATASTLSSARLHVDYASGGGAASGAQIVALRFRDVRIPQGVKIKRATLELVPFETTDRDAEMEIFGVLRPDAAAFGSAAGSRPSDLPTTTESKVWQLDASEPWTAGSPVQSPDIKKVIEEIVKDQSDWCGGNDLALLVKVSGAGGTRGAFSFDSDPVFAPKLQVDFDERSIVDKPGKGCTVKEIRRVVAGPRDDAEQDAHLGSLALVSPSLEFFDDGVQVRENGIRFRNVTVPAGATILGANITLTAATSSAGAADMQIHAEKIGDSPEFATGSGTDVMSRIQTASAVTWDAGSTPSIDTPSGASTPTAGWVQESRYTTPDLSAIISEIVNDSGLGWQFGNAMSFLFEGSGLRRAKSFDEDAAFAASLYVKFQVNLGDLPAEQIVFTSVRERLKEIVRGLAPGGYTPIVDTLYEAARYYRGEPVNYGLTRGNGATSVQQSTRVSHAASFINGTVDRPGGCKETNLSSLGCINEEIIGDGGTPTYVSPVTTACQSSFIVLLTDGFANHNHSPDLIRTLTGNPACDATLSDGTTPVRTGEECGLDLVRFLHDQDQLPSTVPGVNGVTTYTIGFNISTQWLRDLATVGGGSFFTASSTQSLVQVFQQIFAEVLSQNTSFAAPSLSVNAFNKLFHRNEVYFSLFKPTDTARWAGNVKKYRVRSTCAGLPASQCTVGEVIDANDNPAINVDDQRIRDTAQSFWTDPGMPDGADTLKGGAGAELIGPSGSPIHPTRRLFTWIDPNPPDNSDLVTPDRRNEIRDANGDGVLDGLATGDLDADLDATKALLGWPGTSVAQLRSLEAGGLIASTTANTLIGDLQTDLHDHIQWIRGQDVDDEDQDGDTTEDRYSFTDPLHSSPVAITYGAADTTDATTAGKTPIVKLFVGTNDGALRMVNASNFYDDEGTTLLAGDSGGKEEWAFYPRSVLANLVAVRRNVSNAHIYGIDGTPTVWVNDENEDGIIDPTLDVDGDGTTEFVHVFVSMRRGGRQIFAFDATPKNGPITDAAALDSVDPVYIGRLDGGSVEFPALDETWSRPRLGRVMIGNPANDTTSVRDVLIFGGGYTSDVYDGAFPPTGGGSGNAIYVVDAKTGERLLSVSATDPGSGDRVIVPEMVYSIPSDIALMDSDGDGAIDRLYAGDVGGQIWRVDLGPKNSTNSSPSGLPGIKATVGKLATVSDPAELADHRKFFYPPDVVQVRSDHSTSAVDYDLVVAATGARPSPLNTDVQDRAFALRDVTIGRMTDANHDGLAEGYTTIQGPLESQPKPNGDLFDLTNTIDPTATAASATQFATAKGWYLDFTAAGEKSLAAPVVLAGKLFFTTYLPEDVISTSACAIAEGKGQLYGINVLNGAPAFNWETAPDRPNDPTVTRTRGDRTMELGGGIPSGAVPIFQPEAVTLLIGGGGGATVVNPDIALPRERTYWFEEQ